MEIRRRSIAVKKLAIKNLKEYVFFQVSLSYRYELIRLKIPLDFIKKVQD